jgi:hypothetical protein
MPARPSGRLPPFASTRDRSRPGPCIDGFGTCVSAVVLLAAAVAVFVVGQNLDHHLYRMAATVGAGETTGVAVAK